MSAFRKFLLMASSAVVLSSISSFQSTTAMAADVAPGCSAGFAGTVGAGYIFGGSDTEFDSNIVFLDDDDDNDDLNVDYGTFFGEGAALYEFCNTGLNIQGDFAFHSHQLDSDDFFGGKGPPWESDIVNDRWHVGGILFWRNEDLGLVGIDGSMINDDVDSFNNESFRVGLRGEYFAGDMFTVGAGFGYNHGDLFGSDWDGFDANIWARLYATDNIGLLARFDWAGFDIDDAEFAPPGSIDVWAVTGEGEFLLPDHPLSIFAGVRYAEQQLDQGDGKFDFGATTDHLQIYAGLRLYFGSEGLSLSSHHRSNTLDNTSVPLERIPASFFSGKRPI
jgi:hypothetical protein